MWATTTGSIANSYSEEAVTDADGSYNPNSVGGFAGYNSGYVSDSYSTGTVTDNAAGDYVGGFVGSEDKAVPEFSDPGSSCTNDYWDNTLFNSSLPSAGYTWYGSSTGGPGPVTGVKPLSDSQMYYSANFSGFDFTNIWDQVDGQTYPFLRAFEVPVYMPFPLNKLVRSFILPSSALPNYIFFVKPTIDPLSLSWGTRSPYGIIISRLTKEEVKIANKLSNKGATWVFKKYLKKTGVSDEEASTIVDIFEDLYELIVKLITLIDIF